MAISAEKKETFRISLSRDSGDTKTTFEIVPLDQFEFLSCASIYQKYLGDINTEKDIGKLIDIFSSPDGESLKNMLRAFFKDHVVEIRNILIDSEFQVLSGDKIDINLLKPLDIFDLLSQTMNKVYMTEEEEKN